MARQSRQTVRAPCTRLTADPVAEVLPSATAQDPTDRAHSSSGFHPPIEPLNGHDIREDPCNTHSTMFKLVRHYALASLVCIVVAGIALIYLYRSVSLQTVVQLSEKANLALGHAVLNSVRSKLLDYMKGVAYVGPASLRRQALPSELADAIDDLMKDTTVVKVKIYNRSGVVVFSTQASEVGMIQNDNPGFIGAISGNHVSSIVYRDSFNAFDQSTEEDNLLQTYIPIRASPKDPIQGIFEIYTDVNPLLTRNEQTLFIILAGATLVLMMLYGTQLLVVRRASNIIEGQQRTIRERTASLELLSAQMLKNDESQRKKLALELHEGLAQTLSAIKLEVEMSGQGAHPGGTGPQSANSIVALLQAAIEEIRVMASALRPLSLDELGLVPTITWFCREFHRLHPEIEVEQRVSIDESKIAAPLKVVIFRILESALGAIARDAGSDRIGLTLSNSGVAVQLIIDERPILATAALPEFEKADPANRFADLHERTIQSGGSFSATHRVTGGTVLCASWPC